MPLPALLRGWLAQLLLAVALPGALLAVAYLLLQSGRYPGSFNALTPWLPYLLLVPGLLLAYLAFWMTLIALRGLRYRLMTREPGHASL